MRKLLVGLAIVGALGLGAVLVAALVLRVWGDPVERIASVFRPANPNPYPPSSRLHAPFQAYLGRLQALPEYQDYVRGVRSKQEGFSAGFQLTRNGMKRLGDGALERRAAILAAALDRMGEADCARLMHGDAADLRQASERVMAALEQLETEAITDWFELSYQAAVAQLRSTPEPPLAQPAVADAMRALMATLPEPDARRLAASLGSMARSSDADACWAGRTLYRAALTLPGEHRAALARAFVHD